MAYPGQDIFSVPPKMTTSSPPVRPRTAPVDSVFANFDTTRDDPMTASFSLPMAPAPAPAFQPPLTFEPFAERPLRTKIVSRPASYQPQMSTPYRAPRNNDTANLQQQLIDLEQELSVARNENQVLHNTVATLQGALRNSEKRYTALKNSQSSTAGESPPATPPLGNVPTDPRTALHISSLQVALREAQRQNEALQQRLSVLENPIMMNDLSPPPQQSTAKAPGVTAQQAFRQLQEVVDRRDVTDQECEEALLTFLRTSKGKFQPTVGNMDEDLSASSVLRAVVMFPLAADILEESQQDEIEEMRLWHGVLTSAGLNQTQMEQFAGMRHDLLLQGKAMMRERVAITEELHKFFRDNVLYTRRWSLRGQATDAAGVARACQLLKDLRTNLTEERSLQFAIKSRCDSIMSARSQAKFILLTFHHNVFAMGALHAVSELHRESAAIPAIPLHGGLGGL